MGRSGDGASNPFPVARAVATGDAFRARAAARRRPAWARGRGPLSTGFVTAQRSRALQALAAAPWQRLVGLRQAEVTNLLTTEIGRVANASGYLVQCVVALAMLVVQGALALAPLLAAAAPLLVVLGGGGVLLAQGRTRDLGGALVRGNTALAGHVGAVLGGLKVAAAQNAQGAFLAEFAGTQRDLQTTALAFSKRQADGRRTVAIASAAVLDEAMNAIDAAGEARLLARLAALDPRPEIVMISHRAESVAVCDHVIEVRDGVVRTMPGR